jgi:hypothetical protein
MVRVEDAEAHCAHARDRGATILSPAADQPFGERQYAARDFAGRTWVFTQSIAGVDPAFWGGELSDDRADQSRPGPLTTSPPFITKDTAYRRDGS